MARYTLPLIERKEIAEQTMSFRFGLDGQSFAFQPGQFVRVTLINPPYRDEKSIARSFSIASAPGEPHLMVPMRMTGSAFKRSLAELPVGAKVNVNGPIGDFLLEPAAPAALLDGGIGITPFRGMIQDALDRPAPRALTLLYANRTPEDAAFLDELTGWTQRLAGFRLVALMTQPEKSRRGWTGATGHLTSALLRATMGDLNRLPCYVAGPPRFVTGARQALAEAGASPEQIHEDEFTGY